jgi:quercetin dioxygenase-like cupin family protein
MKPRSLLPLLLASLPFLVNAQTPASAPSAPLGSQVLDWTKLAVIPTKNGERRSLFDGPTKTFVNAEGHVTTLNPGESPHEPHRHPDEELIIVKEGLIEVTVNGHAQRAGPGSVFFFASEDLHGMRNVGTTRSTYFVFRFVTPASASPAKPS